MIRHSILSIDYLKKLHGRCKPSLYREIHGVSVKVSSQRYKLFKENCRCVRCGIEGKFLAIEKFDPNIKNYHINMYAVNDRGEEVLMTKDHIIPKSKGGKDVMENYQTMCRICNGNKGNGDSKSLKGLFNDFVFIKTNKAIDKIDKLCFELDVNPSDFWYYYLKSGLDDFTGIDFLSNLLTYFHYYLDTQVDKLLEKNGIDLRNCYFHIEDKHIHLEYETWSTSLDPNGVPSDNDEFEKKVINASFRIKKRLMENKIFAYFMKKCKIDIFNDKEIRALKLETLNQ